MNSITVDWITDWAGQRQMCITVDGVLSLGYQDPVPSQIIILIDSERTPDDLVLLANRLVWVDSEDEPNCLSIEDRQYLFCVRESGIWGDIQEELASEAFGSLFRGHALPSDTTACLVSESESRVAVLLVLNAIVFGWDAYLVPLSGRFVCHVSHHGYVGLMTPEKALRRGLLERFKAWGAEEKSCPTGCGEE